MASRQNRRGGRDEGTNEDLQGKIAGIMVEIKKKFNEKECIEFREDNSNIKEIITNSSAKRGEDYCKLVEALIS